MPTPHRLPRPHAPLRRIGALTLLALAACDNGSEQMAPGVADEPIVAADGALPGVVVTITDVRGRTGSGRAAVGDHLEVDFTIATDAGAPLELATFARGSILVSGPTFDYQRVIPSQSDVIQNSVKTAVGAFRYRFQTPIPTVYEAPYNDTTDLTDGERTGQELLSGTYTVALALRKDYVVDAVTLRDAGNTTGDFLLGSATELATREVVTAANCNRCHGELRAHGDNYTDLTGCLSCHTSGAEDKNVATAAGGTPGATIDFKVMIHKIHAGRHLPSVNGVTTAANGVRDYAATKTPYQLVGFGDTVHDYSEVAMPLWPSLAHPTPRDLGYDALTSDQQALEDTVRSGPVDCAACHGDPDGDGPLPAPSQGELAYTQPSVAACNSCHDDWNPDHLYTANGQTMPAERDNATCKQCHRPSGGPLDVEDAHRHPLADPSFATGLRFSLQSVADVAGDDDGALDPGERVEVTMTIEDSANTPVAANTLSRVELVLEGPTDNPNLVHYTTVSPASLGTGPGYTFRLPEQLYYEPVGNSNAGVNGEVFATARTPHRDVGEGATSLLLRTGTGAGSTLASAAAVRQNFVDVQVGDGASFAADDFVVIDDGDAGRREFLKVQRVDGDRLWFGTTYSSSYAPGLRGPHTVGTTIDVVVVPRDGNGDEVVIPASSYTLDDVTGTITESSEFGAGELLVSYTSDFVVPDTFAAPFNDSPDLDEADGDWGGLSLLSGTYTLGIWGRRDRTFTVDVGGATQSTSYREAADAAVASVLVGSATTLQPSARIDSAAACYRCHNDIQFHGGSRRGYDTCIRCHGLAGAEDAPTYRYPSGTATPGVTVDFRTMLHKIHHGKELAAGASYQVAGFGGNPHSYESVGHPTRGGTKDCASCHGETTSAWTEPAARSHPGQTVATQSWRVTCTACHDTAAAIAHVEASISPSGAEACAVCHGAGEEHDVRRAHIVR